MMKVGKADFHLEYSASAEFFTAYTRNFGKAEILHSWKQASAYAEYSIQRSSFHSRETRKSAFIVSSSRNRSILNACVIIVIDISVIQSMHTRS